MLGNDIAQVEDKMRLAIAGPRLHGGCDGYTVVVASNGDEALWLMRRSHLIVWAMFASLAGGHINSGAVHSALVRLNSQIGAA